MELFFTRRNRSPLILAVIFITFLHSVLSRHRIRHYKDRFKRQQGAHLYLPESFVTEGGEGPEEGPWSDWSEPSPCSRTCGGGVSTQYRQCQQGYTCQGADKRHFSCNTQDCPDTGDFRAQQCSEYDEVPFENIKYQWVPYTKGPNPCELNCMPKGQRFYYRHAPHVIDGTRCNDESFDVCVNGQCQPVGCDMMLGSELKEDECRICGGDGSTCNTISNTLELNDLQVGYNDILLIPDGATNIVVEETIPSNNYLAVRNTSGHYYLNGNWRIDLPRTFEFAGSKFHYERYPQGFAAPDKIYTLGPIDEPLFIVLLFQDNAVPVQYKYSLPTNVQPGSESETYAWTFDEFTPCSATCGGGIQHRNVSCAGRKTLEPVDENLCDAAKKPDTSRKCNEIACEAHWVPHPWGNCSVPCGEDGGVQTREISCQQVVSNGYPTLVDDSECLGPKPPQQQKCNQGKTCATWYTEPWKPCDHLCGNGKQTRKVQCFIKDEKNNIQVLDDQQCEAVTPKPSQEQTCFIRPCEGVDWIASEWSGCDSVCGLTNETRKLFCATSNGQIYGDELCDQNKKPESVRGCDGNQNASCNYLWYASQWSECSAKCGKGVESRVLFCGLSTAHGVEKVENNKCDQKRTFETVRNCTGTEECDGEWFSGPWEECSKPCGGGRRKKKVVCVKGNEIVGASHCDETNIIFSDEECNSEPCTEDSVLPVDKEKPLPLQEKETTVEHTTIESSTVSSQETEGTQSDVSSSDIEELTKSFEITSEPDTDKPSEKESEEDYEIVDSDTCDDGEWIDILGVPEDEDTEATELTETTDILDMMYSDGSTFGEPMLTGSGDAETHSTTEKSLSISTTAFTEEEGSGETSSIIVDEEKSSVSYISASQSISSSTEEATKISATASTDISGSKITSESIGSSDMFMTTEETAAGTAKTESSGTYASSEPSAFSEMSTFSGITETTELHEISEVFEATELSTLTGTSAIGGSSETSSSTEKSETKTGATDKDTESVTEISMISTQPTSESSETSSSTESTENSSSTETSESSISTEISESTEFSVSTETTTEQTEETETSWYSETNEVTTESRIKTTDHKDLTSTPSSTDGGEVIKEEPGADIPTPPSREVINDDEETTTVGTEFASEGTSEKAGTSTSTEISGSTASEEKTDFSTSVTTEGSAFTEDTTKVTGTSEVSGLTDVSTFSSSVDISGSTEITGTTEISGTTSVSGTTESLITDLSSSSMTIEIEETVTSESTTEFSGTTEFDIFSSTSEITTEETTWPTTHISEIFKKRHKMCKRRKILQCQKSKYGCCWDKIHSAEGPFDKGCPAPKTCKESTYGCCADGVSAALGPKNRGCPPSHCNETLFGCCWDKKTPAEGNNEQGCPPRPPACLESKWGCCKDNTTEAKGPKQKGCEPEKEDTSTEVSPIPSEECSKTKYGCCPDQSPAKGPQYQGCNITCSSSPYGCCPDKETPAHGPQGEGCCLKGPFGCCPDDITPATGANGIGCECQYTQYGCCPDRVTHSKGPNNEGCGCKYTEHGCCPDDSTPASGPSYKGCPCHTFQFGCCPDGVSIAEGPHQQGCDCRTSEYGCCSDEKTSAQGPNNEGCGCDVSKYGCCLDGVSEAKGINYEGCEEVPVDHQDACSLPEERGPCQNYTVKWFFQMSYGGCSRFWYGGCEGNDNRFRTREECEGICVKPQGPDRCKLPKVQGSCEGYFLQWYYDKESRHCSQFVYSGCLGNNNRFETREECTSLCATEDIVDPCEQSAEEGPCRGQYRRYFYDKTATQCKEFIYGGCKGNSNNFATIEACNQKCATPGKKRDYCTIPKAEGNCTAREAKWYYDTREGRCSPFYYTGCNSNKNSFDSKEACQEDCPSEVGKDTCHLPAEIGECGNYVNRWYWDTKNKRCMQFYWGGCGGNGNNFQTEQECTDSCSAKEPQVPEQLPTPDERPPQTQPPWPTGQVPSPTSRIPTLEEICSLFPDPGPCDDYKLHYYYDGADGICKNFTYGGCGGNYNNFETEEMCLQYCGSTRGLPHIPESVQTIAPVELTRPPIVEAPPVADTQCYDPPDPGNCSDTYSAFFFDRSSGECRPFDYTGCGGNRNRFYSQEDCERRCGSYRGQDICNIEKDSGSCRGYFIKYYYDKLVGRCEQFAYGGCQGNGNRFSSLEECEHYCGHQEEPKPTLTSAEICQLQADPGSCPDANRKRWYFDNTQGQCIPFTYSGCGGNQNNFVTFQKCLEFCKEFLPYTGPPVAEPDIFAPHECQRKFDECNTLRCPYGIEAYVDESDCNGCRCRDPCKDIECPETTQCGIDLNRNKTSPQDADFVAVCREINKTGQCPSSPTNSSCDKECYNDADCALHLKCCETSCGTACLEPARPLEPVTQTNEPGYTQAPVVDTYYPPRIDVEIYEPDLTALLGDQAVLNCAVSGNPNPRITWSKDNVIIDGTQPRYRIRLDQTLQIITLHKTDSGVYLCTADNSIGSPIQNQIKLEVLDSPTDRQVTILNGGDPELLVNNVVTSFNSPATLNCYALGWPLPAVTWWKEDELIPLRNREFEVTKDYSLLIHSVQLHNLGVYTCQAYNGVGKAASWSVTVKAKGPYYSTNPRDVKYLQYVVNPSERTTTSTENPIIRGSTPPSRAAYLPVQRPTPQPYLPPVYATEPNPDIIDSNPDIIDPNEILPEVPEAAGHRIPPPDSVYIVPVRANITTNDRRYPTGSNIEISCDVYGYPPPQVTWYKDGVPLVLNDRISDSDTHTLTIKAAEKSDSGRYQCEAINQYSKASSTIDILIEGMYIHPSCTDNQFFANCKLIVKAKYCNHKYYAKFCCRSCTEAGELPVDGPHLGLNIQQSPLDTNVI